MVPLNQSSVAQKLAGRFALTRRDFLRDAAGLALGGALVGSGVLARAGIAPRNRKVVVITFGGGARDQETFAPQGQGNIPHLMNELIPQATFFTQVVNRGILGHYVATASLATGVYKRCHFAPNRAGHLASPPSPRCSDSLRQGESTAIRIGPPLRWGNGADGICSPAYSPHQLLIHS